MQLKSSFMGARRSEVTANVKLLDRPSACILWIFFDPDTLLLGPFLWFGGVAGERIPPLGEKIARHTKPNAKLEKADRPAHRVAKKPVREARHDRPLELKVFRLASQFVKCSLGVVAIGRSLFLPDIELAKY